MNSSPQDPHQPQQWDYRQFNFAYPTRGALHDDPPVQFPLQQQQVQHTQYQPYPQQFPLQPAPYGPAQTSNTAANMNHNSDIPTHNPTNVDSPPPVSLPSAVKRKRATKTAITTPLPSAGSDSSDSENVSGEFGGTGTSACVGDSASPSKAPRLRGACTNCKKLKMKCNFRTSGIASPGLYLSV
ncbi:hypothetical protein C8R47DRAFT_606558 [Mycena vitilis]|nr:hypothetical protein C8R47DRAFT_606558 [Mycena vitilis]